MFPGPKDGLSACICLITISITCWTTILRRDVRWFDCCWPIPKHPKNDQNISKSFKYIQSHSNPQTCHQPSPTIGAPILHIDYRGTTHSRKVFSWDRRSSRSMVMVFAHLMAQPTNLGAAGVAGVSQGEKWSGTGVDKITAQFTDASNRNYV